MIDLFKTVILFLLTPECYDQYFVNFNFLHGECMKATISKGLGLVVIAGSITVKVPQILKIVNNRSAQGISLTGSLLELTAITSFFSYGYVKQFPFSAWGEGLFIGIQTAVVITLIFYYKKQFSQLVGFSVAYSAIVFLVVSKVIPVSFLWLMQVLNLPIIMLGKGIQAMTNYKNKSTGQLSAITCWMQFAGAVARVFTSIQETGDTAMVLSFIVASIFNGIIVFQLFHYGKSSSKKSKKKGGKAKGKKSE